MKQLKIFCDICGYEFLPQQFLFLNGILGRLNEKLESVLMTYEGHYCVNHAEKIIKYIEELTIKEKNAKDSGAG